MEMRIYLLILLFNSGFPLSREWQKSFAGSMNRTPTFQ